MDCFSFSLSRSLLDFLSHLRILLTSHVASISITPTFFFFFWHKNHLQLGFLVWLVSSSIVSFLLAIYILINCNLFSLQVDFSNSGSVPALKVYRKVSSFLSTFVFKIEFFNVLLRIHVSLQFGKNRTESIRNGNQKRTELIRFCCVRLRTEF